MSNVLHDRPRAIGGQVFFWYCATFGNVQSSRIARDFTRDRSLHTKCTFELEEALAEREDMFFYG